MKKNIYSNIYSIVAHFDGKVPQNDSKRFNSLTQTQICNLRPKIFRKTKLLQVHKRQP